MKVCIIALVSPNQGGMFHYSLEFIKAISKYCETVVVAPEKSINIYRNIQKIKIIPFSENSRFKLFLFFLRIRKLIKKLKIDIIHDPIGSSKPVKTLLWKILLHKCAVVVSTIHDPTPHSGMSLLRRILINFVTKINIFFSDGICVHYQEAKKAIMKCGYSQGKIFVVHHGLYSIFGENDKFIFTAPTVLFFGELRYNKGIDRLIKIADIVHKEIPQVKFVVAGNSKPIEQHSRKLRDIIKKAIKTMKETEYFEVIDRYVSDDEVKEFFTKATLVVLPYRDATQSGIVGIAYAFSKPVIATKVGGLTEIIVHGETGFLVEENTEEKIAEYIIKLLRNPELCKKMGENAYQLYKTELSWDNFAKKIVEFYKNLVIA
jgi:starch synthase